MNKFIEANYPESIKILFGMDRLQEANYVKTDSIEKYTRKGTGNRLNYLRPYYMSGALSIGIDKLKRPFIAIRSMHTNEKGREYGFLDVIHQQSVNDKDKWVRDNYNYSRVYKDIPELIMDYGMINQQFIHTTTMLLQGDFDEFEMS
jgi:hypothetical protein